MGRSWGQCDFEALLKLSEQIAKYSSLDGDQLCRRAAKQLAQILLNKVEFGHRQQPGRYVPALGKRLRESWVPGRYMLTISEQELRALAPRLLQDLLYDTMREVFSRT